jgi:hypothetical protein
MDWFSLNRFDQPQPLNSALFLSEDDVRHFLLIQIQLPPFKRGFHVPPRPRHSRPPKFPYAS